MTRAEHMRWCKKRAHEYLAQGNARDAYASMLSDLGKHEETKGMQEFAGMMMLVENGPAFNVAECRRFIDGFAE